MCLMSPSKQAMEEKVDTVETVEAVENINNINVISTGTKVYSNAFQAGWRRE
jgi:hypothetical protein